MWSQNVNCRSQTVIILICWLCHIISQQWECQDLQRLSLFSCFMIIILQKLRCFLHCVPFGLWFFPQPTWVTVSSLKHWEILNIGFLLFYISKWRVVEALQEGCKQFCWRMAMFWDFHWSASEEQRAACSSHAKHCCPLRALSIMQGPLQVFSICMYRLGLTDSNAKYWLANALMENRL